MVFWGEEGHELDILVGRGWEAVEQDDDRGRLGTCFAVEDSDPVWESLVHLALGMHVDVSGLYSVAVPLFVLLPSDTCDLFVPTLLVPILNVIPAEHVSKGNHSVPGQQDNAMVGWW